MGTTLQVKTFDYSGFDKETKSRLICRAANIKKSKGAIVESVLAVGQEVAGANEDLAAAGQEGKFTEWVELNCNFSKSTAYNYMRAYEAFGDVNTKTIAQVDDSAMYLLAAPNAPPAATKEALKIADKGIQVTKKLAQEILAKHARKKSIVQPVARFNPEENDGFEDEEDETDTSKGSSTGGVEEPPAEDADPVFIDPDSLENVQADLRQYEKDLRDLARKGRKILGAVENEVKRPWCGRYSILTLIQPLQHVARTVLNDLPVGGTASDPVIAREEAAENA